MSLYQVADSQQLESLIFVIVDQLNHGSIPETFRLEAANLNHRAASKALLTRSNVVAAYFYASIAVKLLPPDQWTSAYGLCCKVYLVLGNAAHTNGRMDEAAR